jgi:nucleotide-binding universal stress UspA family protein
VSGPTIVVGWSPDRYGEVAVAHALDEARLRGYRVLVVNATRGDALVDRRFAGRDALALLEETLAASGVEHELRQVMGSDVGDEVIAAAEQVDAAFIVIGLRRRTPVGKLLMGSVAQRILLGSQCPVHAVKVPDQDE